MDPPALHRDALVIDTHNDSIVSRIRRGRLGIAGETRPDLQERAGTVELLRGPLPAEARAGTGQIDLPQLRAGGIDAAFFAVDVTQAWKNHLPYALDALGFFLADLAGQPEDDPAVVVARSAEEIVAARASQRIAAVLVVENSDVLEGSVNVLDVLHAVGVRSITLTHNPTSWAAAGNAEAASGGGLTCFGRRLVRQMNRLGMLVDVSHIAERGFYHTLEASERPVIASHSCCAALCAHPRNLDDAQLRALASEGGVACITFVPSFLDPDWRESNPPRCPGLDAVLRHVDHAVTVAGIDHVGIGSDFDGGGTALPDAGAFPQITAGLLERGYDEKAVRKILGLNVLRLLEQTLRGRSAPITPPA